jgi:hypothetical protein
MKVPPRRSALIGSRFARLAFAERRASLLLSEGHEVKDVWKKRLHSLRVLSLLSFDGRAGYNAGGFLPAVHSGPDYLVHGHP